MHICYDIKVPDKKKGSKFIPCIECQKPCDSATSYRQHFISLHTEEKHFECTAVASCDFRGKHNHDIFQHIRRVHKKAIAKYLCQECGKAFMHNSILRDHVAIV